MSAADAIRAAAQAGEKFPSVMMRAALAAQEMKVGYVEGMGRMAEETQAFSDVLNRAQLYAEDVGFSEQMEASFYQSLGRMASALMQENLLAPLFKLGQEAVGGLLSAGKSLFLAEGGLVTKPTLAVLGEAGPEVVLPLAA
ncbi:MAG: hypothetical protein HYY66_00150 [Candidatus Tectomicrobia bacterium]|nr:hypothetical protein [Candidatus Tectomicrobia bacterium]